MNEIAAKPKRLSIYMRDGMRCVYCSRSLESASVAADGGEMSLTLDHVIPRSKGGDDEADNLVTACKRCKTARGNMSLAAFSRKAAEFDDVKAKPETILKRARGAAQRKIKNYADAKDIMESELNWTKSLGQATHNALRGRG